MPPAPTQFKVQLKSNRFSMKKFDVFAISGASRLWPRLCLSVFLAIAVAAMGGGNTPIDKEQKIKVSIVTFPSGETEGFTSVRVTFQRIVWNTYGQVSRLEKLNEPEMHQEFFNKLSKAIFLEAHNL